MAHNAFRLTPRTPPSKLKLKRHQSPGTMATEMKLLLSAKEHLLLGFTLLLVPLMALEFYAIGSYRAQHPEWASDPRMPHAVDFLSALGYSLAIVAARYVLTRALKPLARVLLEPKKRHNEDRVERFTTVLFKLM